MDQVKEIAKAVKLTSYDVEFEDRGGVHFIYLLLEDGTRIPQELRTGWPQLLRGSLETLRAQSEKVHSTKEAPLTVAVLHKPTGRWTASDVLRKQVREFAEAVTASFKDSATPADFAVIEIDWASKHLNISKLE